MPPNENPRQQDIPDYDNIDLGTEHTSDEHEKNEDVSSQIKSAISSYERNGMEEQIEQAKEQGILVSTEELYLADRIQYVYNVLKNSDTNTKPKIAKFHLDIFAKSQKKFHEIVRSKETVREREKDNKERDRATKDMDAYLNESKEIENKNPTRCVIKLHPDEIARINVPGGDVIEIYDQKEIVRFPVVSMDNKGRSAEVKIPEEFRDQAHGAKTGSIIIGPAKGSRYREKLRYSVEVSVKDLERIEYILSRTVDQLREVREEEGPTDFWPIFQEIHQKHIKNAIGSAAYDILMGNEERAHGKWFSVPTEEDSARATVYDIDDRIKKTQDWVSNIRNIVKDREPNEMLSIDADGNIEE